MAEDEPIRGSVAQILNSRDLVINRGTEAGVEVGMVFQVLSPNAEDIEDPETGEILGSVDRPKVEVRIVDVEDRLAVARTFKSTRVNVGGKSTSIAFDRLFQPPKYETRYETLKTDEKTWEDLSEDQSFVKTGDPVKQVIDE